MQEMRPLQDRQRPLPLRRGLTFGLARNSGGAGDIARCRRRPGQGRGQSQPAVGHPGPDRQPDRRRLRHLGTGNAGRSQRGAGPSTGHRHRQYRGVKHRQHPFGSGTSGADIRPEHIAFRHTRILCFHADRLGAFHRSRVSGANYLGAWAGPLGGPHIRSGRCHLGRPARTAATAPRTPKRWQAQIR